MTTQDDATLELMLADHELRGFAVRMLNEALHQMRYDLKYGTPAAKALIYRTVTSTILRQSLAKANDEGIEELRNELDKLREEMRTSAPTTVDRQIIRAIPDAPPRPKRAKVPPAIPHRTYSKASFSTKDL